MGNAEGTVAPQCANTSDATNPLRTVVHSLALPSSALRRASLRLPELAPESIPARPHKVIALLPSRTRRALAPFADESGTASIGSDSRPTRARLPDTANHTYAVRAGIVCADVLQCRQTVALALALPRTALGRHLVPPDDAPLLALAADARAIERTCVRRRARACSRSAKRR